MATFIAAAMAAGTSAEVRVTAVPIGEKPVETPAKVSSTAELLVYENFDKWIEGSVEDPDYDNPLVSDENPLIDPQLMNDDMQWTGDKVYSAGGTCALRTFDPNYKACINTPKGDYSGSVKVTFLAKYSPVYWEDEGGHTWHWDGSTISVGLYTDDFKNFQVGEEDGYPGALLSNLRLYESFGWYEVTVEFDNFTAYNDAYISFFCSDGVLLDNIKVTSSIDKFMPAPIIDSVTDVTETSFTVNFQPVRKSYNYYMYLFTLEGYDKETGEPLFSPVFDPETMAMLEEYGMTVEEYIEIMGGMDSPYTNYGRVSAGEPTSFTYEGLDPAVDYYYAVRSHYVLQFSDYEIIPMNKIAAPIVNDATDINPDSFTANWQSVVKADSYEVNLYGVNRVVEDNDNFIIFEEDFDNVSGYTDKDDIYDPDVVESSSGLTIDDLTSTPGWDTEIDHVLLVDGMLGLDYENYWLFTPELYVAGDDKIVISLRAQFVNDVQIFYVKFAGNLYQVPVNGDVFEGEFELPTHGLEVAKLQITGPQYDMIFIDYIQISQSLKKGDFTYTYMGSEVTEDTSASFSGINANSFDFYGYAVEAIKGEGYAAIYSESSERMIVDLKNGESFAGVTAIDTVNTGEVVEVERYSIDGKKLNAPTKGLNIIRMSDGSVRKVMVK